ncbi:hypothetical protein LSAT2_021017 [Lamellibrachia satsuma]|nr:hypothetical protein LSAT2_021017 [Lamellibrachia satsuma]
MATNTFWILCVVASYVLSVDATLEEEALTHWEHSSEYNAIKRCLKHCDEKQRSCTKKAYDCPYYEHLNTHDLIIECYGLNAKIKFVLLPATSTARVRRLDGRKRPDRRGTASCTVAHAVVGDRARASYVDDINPQTTGSDVGIDDHGPPGSKRAVSKVSVMLAHGDFCPVNLDSIL